MNFVTIDVETANPDYSSICQLGIVVVRNGQIAASKSILIDPEDYFDPYNISIHGITSKKVLGSPRFGDVFPCLAESFKPFPILHHGPFDRVAILRGFQKIDKNPIQLRWLDVTRIVRRTWPKFSKSGYSLKNLTSHFGIPLNHHDALSDASATTQIALLALNESGLSLNDWFERVETPNSSGAQISNRVLEGYEAGKYSGETIVFTGTMQNPRSEAATAAQKQGFNVGVSVTKKTTVVCIGNIQDREKFAGYDKSSKHRKALELIESGADIKIITEDDFYQLIAI